MADIKSPEARSQNMAKIRSHDTKTEVWFRKKLFARGYRYRTNVASVPGHPDIYLAKYHVAVFVHGCFWHRHSGCKYAYTPKSRVDFWQKKFRANMDRDAVVKQELYNRGIKALVIWECTIRQMKRSEADEASVLDKVESFIHSDSLWAEL